jgi:hypothetical protein
MKRAKHIFFLFFKEIFLNLQANLPVVRSISYDTSVNNTANVGEIEVYIGKDRFYFFLV